MDEPPAIADAPRSSDDPPRLRAPTTLILTVLLLASAAPYVGYHAWIAFDPDDTNHLETTLILPIAREATNGPSSLYGPFTGENPFVLIHAPLYYRVAGALTWIAARAGAGPILSAMAVGRALSFAGFACLVVAAGWIARGGGMTRIVSPWAALLVAASPIFSSFGVAVRPDTCGIALQTVGFGLVLSSLRDGSIRWQLVLSGALFGLAFCVKQNLVVAAGVGALLVVASALRDGSRRLPTVGFLFLMSAVPCAYYAWEQSLTRGEMSRSAFLLPGHLRVVAPASWEYVGTVFFEIAKLSIGPIALALGVFLAGPKRAIVGTRLDAALWLVFLAEAAAIVPLCKGSSGAWTNYAQPATVWAAILIARAASRVVASPSLGVRTLAIWAGAFGLFANDARLVAISHSNRVEGRLLLARVLADPDMASSSAESRYFSAVPQYNRLYGRVGLAHDEWLYGAFESSNMAQPRSEWLASALRGPVTVVIAKATERGDEFVDGVPQSLPSLGFRRANGYVMYSVWVRDAPTPEAR